MTSASGLAEGRRDRTWKEADIRLQGFIMRLAIKGGPTRTDMMNTDKACNAVTDAAAPLY